MIIYRFILGDNKELACLLKETRPDCVIYPSVLTGPFICELPREAKYLNIKSILSIVGNLRISDQVAEICKVKSPKIVIIPYEGHAWKRVLIYKIKNHFPRIKIIGYQFSIIYEDSH